MTQKTDQQIITETMHMLETQDRYSFPEAPDFMDDHEIQQHIVESQNVKDAATRYLAVQHGLYPSDVYWQRCDNYAHYPEDRASKRHQQDIKILLAAMVAQQARDIIVKDARK